MKISTSIALAASAATLMLGLTACSKADRVTTSAAGHTISASVEGTYSIDSGTNRAVIASDFGKITVERARAQIGDGPWTKIPEGVAVIAGISKHKRWFQAGGVSVKESSSL